MGQKYPNLRAGAVGSLQLHSSGTDASAANRWPLLDVLLAEFGASEQSEHQNTKTSYNTCSGPDGHQGTCADEMNCEKTLPGSSLMAIGPFLSPI